MNEELPTQDESGLNDNHQVGDFREIYIKQYKKLFEENSQVK